ncbi:hypothetical protein EVAR_26002_1 [Eumeta japonica]|uniref:EGF-like domain-containing protein n=1 Tax=Eumeta variegata TaxID=151549 RepID=A0A4C1V1I6_EUMVA|nr:hypothetical protein EVAR_26002_1 [Eumeta japonica]
MRVLRPTKHHLEQTIILLDIFSFAGECAPTLAPWKSKELSTTSEAVPDRQENHALYDINDIVHFEDNDVVMRDSRTDVTEANGNDLDNSIEQFKGDNEIKSYNVGMDRFESKYDVKPKFNEANVEPTAEIDNEVTSDRIKEDDCQCEHGGGCVAGVCLCPLGYAGVKCEITLDLKVPRFNGSSYLRLPGLGYTAASWLHIEVRLL